MAERSHKRTTVIGLHAAQRIIREAESKAPRELTTEIERASRKALRYPGEEEAFIGSKLTRLESNRVLADESKSNAREHLEGLLRAKGSQTSQPRGGYGYCTLFTPEFLAAFQTGTAIQYFVVCPTTPGGNVDDYLYLTAMNRASQGLEVHPLYYQQNPFSLRIWDWSQGGGNEQALIPFDQLGDYLFNLEYPAGTVNQVIFLVNMTYQVSQADWNNAALLFNYRLTQYDLIYQCPSPYASTTAGQQDGKNGWWGPDVETFQPHYSNTNVMGFLGASLTSRSGEIGPWTPSAWQNLLPSQATVQSGLGFVPVHVDPYYDILVKGGP